MATRYGWCKVCRNQFYYTAETWRGRPRDYCDKHAEDHRKEGQRNRVRKHREAKPKNLTTYTYHLRGCNGKAVCGREMKGHDMAEFLRDDAHNGKVAKLCKSCDRILFRRRTSEDGE